jgi:hypothetical protein
MDQQKDFTTRVNIGDRDSLGKTIDLRLIAAAQAVWERACLLVIRYLAEDTEAPEILETVVDAASRAMAKNKPIKFFEAYLLTAVARESLRRRRKNRRIQYLDGADLERLARPVSTDLDRQLDNAERLKIFRACMDPGGRTMYDFRTMDFGWRWIAELMGYADAHSAEVQFDKKMDKALERYRVYHNSRLKRQSRDKSKLHRMDSDE